MDDAALAKLYARIVRPADHRGPCPSPGDLVRLALGEVAEPEVMALEREVVACAECVADLAHLRASLAWFEASQHALLAGARARRTDAPAATSATRATMHLADAVEGLAAFVRRIVAGIRELADATRPAAALQPGYRASETDSIEARLVGRVPPIILPFRVVRAEIENDGRLVLDLSTTAAVPPGIVRVEATLATCDRRLVLPAAALFPDGRATIVAQLPHAGAVPHIPAAALELRLFSAGETPP